MDAIKGARCFHHLRLAALQGHGDARSGTRSGATDPAEPFSAFRVTWKTFTARVTPLLRNLATRRDLSESFPADLWQPLGLMLESSCLTSILLRWLGSKVSVAPFSSRRTRRSGGALKEKMSMGLGSAWYELQVFLLCCCLTACCRELGVILHIPILAYNLYCALLCAFSHVPRHIIHDAQSTGIDG